MDDNNGWTKLVGDTITPGFPAFAIFGDAIVESDSVSWFSYKDGLLKFHTDSSKRKNYNPQNSIIPSDNCFTIYRSLDIDASGNKWMTSCGGLLKFDGEQAYVEVEIGDQQFERRDVSLGLSDGIRVEILSGITEEDMLKKS